MASLTPVRYGVIALVLALVVAAILADRDLNGPVAGYGVVPQPDATEVVALDSTLEVGDLAPNFRLLSTDGEIVELADLRGQPVLIHFWTTWCIACTSELDAIQNIADGYAGRARVLGIDIGEQSARVGETANDHGLTYPVLLDTDEEVARHYGATPPPVLIVIDANGLISSIETGAVTPDQIEADLEAVVAN